MLDEFNRRNRTAYFNYVPQKTELYAHSVYGRSDKKLDEEEYDKMKMQNPAVIYLEAKCGF